MAIGDVRTVLGAEHVLEENLQGVWELGNSESFHAEVLVGLSANFQIGCAR